MFVITLTYLVILIVNVINCLQPITGGISLELSIIHLNDFHARYEETSLDSGLYKGGGCIGGFSRLYAATKGLMRTRPNPVLLNAGDNFEGTIWHTVHRWNVTQHFFNKLPIDAYTLGNHEFYEKTDQLLIYLNGLKAPVVVANIDASHEPSIANRLNKSTVIQRQGKEIGLIGVMSSRINEIADIGNLILLDEFAAIKREAERLVNEEGVFTNIVISHCGYDVDRKLAKLISSNSRIGIIVDGHTHSFLYSGGIPLKVSVIQSVPPAVVQMKHVDREHHFPPPEYNIGLSESQRFKSYSNFCDFH